MTLWLVATIAKDLIEKIGINIKRIAKLSYSYLGMQLAHTGLAICILGVGLSSAYDQTRELRMVPGDSAVVAGYEFNFSGVNPVVGPNYNAFQAQIKVTKDRYLVANLFPEKRHYNAGGQVMTEAAIDPALTRDIYVSLGEPLGDDAWALSLQVKPFVRCIWLGGILIAIGGLLAAIDRRYRRRKSAKNNEVAA